MPLPGAALTTCGQLEPAAQPSTVTGGANPAACPVAAQVNRQMVVSTTQSRARGTTVITPVHRPGPVVA